MQSRGIAQKSRSIHDRYSFSYLRRNSFLSGSNTNQDTGLQHFLNETGPRTAAAAKPKCLRYTYHPMVAGSDKHSSDDSDGLVPLGDDGDF
jgi:hypothetical protein